MVFKHGNFSHEYFPKLTGFDAKIRPLVHLCLILNITFLKNIVNQGTGTNVLHIDQQQIIGAPAFCWLLRLQQKLK